MGVFSHLLMLLLVVVPFTIILSKTLVADMGSTVVVHISHDSIVVHKDVVMVVVVAAHKVVDGILHVKYAKKSGHQARDCWWRYADNGDDDDSHSHDKNAHLASYGVDKIGILIPEQQIISLEN